jgi:Ferritin-like
MLLIKPELVAGLDDVHGIRTALQSAVELEHSTIPPYLYAIYSLGTDNGDIADIIVSVVAEEMAHVALVCNILNAIGGHPAIDTPRFMPTYPGPLPATVEHALSVPLERMSIDLIKKVFMKIEEPEKPLNIPTAAAAPHPLTIGMFYAKIKAAIQAADKKKNIFTGHQSLQVTHHFASAEVVAVTSVEDAAHAIDLIVEQGEGTTTSPLDGDELAHYYRYWEIAEGKQLVPHHDPQPGTPPWRFDGPPIPFDATKVLPVIANPKTSKYPAGSAAQRGCQTFNYTYTNLLKVLHDTFNGHADRLPTAIGLMESLNEQAQALMTTDSGIGGNAGPSFEYQPTNQ